MKHEEIPKHVKFGKNILLDSGEGPSRSRTAKAQVGSERGEDRSLPSAKV